MRYYVDGDLNCFLEENIEAVIELIKKAYLSTKEFYKNKVLDDFLYFNMYRTFNHGYCFYFARMLKSIYKDASFVVVDKHYAHISHISVLINGNVYDINGKHNLDKYYVLEDEDLQRISLNHYQVKEEVYNKFKEYFYEYLDLYTNYNKQFIVKCKKYT